MIIVILCVAKTVTEHVPRILEIAYNAQMNPCMENFVINYVAQRVC